MSGLVYISQRTRLHVLCPQLPRFYSWTNPNSQDWPIWEADWRCPSSWAAAVRGCPLLPAHLPPQLLLLLLFPELEKEEGVEVNVWKWGGALAYCAFTVLLLCPFLPCPVWGLEGAGAGKGRAAFGSLLKAPGGLGPNLWSPYQTKLNPCFISLPDIETRPDAVHMCFSRKTMRGQSHQNGGPRRCKENVVVHINLWCPIVFCCSYTVFWGNALGVETWFL